MGQKTAARNGRIGWLLKTPFFFISNTKIAEHFSFYDSLNSWNTLFSKNVPYFFHLSDIQRKFNQKIRVDQGNICSSISSTSVVMLGSLHMLQMLNIDYAVRT